jgi:repressor LexA
LNQYIHVKLTEEGKQEHIRQHDQLRIRFPKIGEYVPPIEDEEGFSRWQAWDLFGTFGHMFKLTNPPPFNINIKLETDK